jgi:hypothetical protein
MISAFILGMAAALWLFPILVGPQMQRLRIERDRSVDEVQSLRSELVKLKEAQRSPQWRPVIKVAEVKLEGEVGDRVLLEAQKRVKKELTEHYVGRPLDDVSDLMLFAKFQGREWEIDGVRYRLEIRVVTIRAELTLYGILAAEK